MERSYQSNMMNSSIVVYFLVGLFGLLGVIFLLVGILIGVNSKHKESVCTATTVGEITSYEPRTTKGADGFYETYYHPVYTYYANGEEYVKESAVGTGKAGTAGEKVEIHYNPANPQEFYAESSARNVLTIVFPVLGGIFILVSVILFIIGRR